MGISFYLPSSLVLSNTTELFGPSPTDVKANTLNSYSVFFFSLVTTLISSGLSFTSMSGESVEPFCL